MLIEVAAVRAPSSRNAVGRRTATQASLSCFEMVVKLMPCGLNALSVKPLSLSRLSGWHERKAGVTPGRIMAGQSFPNHEGLAPFLDRANRQGLWYGYRQRAGSSPQLRC